MGHRSELLCGADMPLAHVADMFGFADQAHFTRVLADVVGMTPSAFPGLLAGAALPTLLGGVLSTQMCADAKDPRVVFV